MLWLCTQGVCTRGLGRNDGEQNLFGGEISFNGNCFFE